MCHFSDVQSVQEGEGESGAHTFDKNIFKTSVLTGSSETTGSARKVHQQVEKNEGKFILDAAHLARQDLATLASGHAGFFVDRAIGILFAFPCMRMAVKMSASTRDHRRFGGTIFQSD